VVGLGLFAGHVVMSWSPPMPMARWICQSGMLM